VPVKEASLPHGDTSGEEAQSCEGLIRAMAKGVRGNVSEHDSDKEAESKLENLDGRDLNMEKIYTAKLLENRKPGPRLRTLD
jgi:hypothetical protein